MDEKKHCGSGPGPRSDGVAGGLQQSGPQRQQHHRLRDRLRLGRRLRDHLRLRRTGRPALRQSVYNGRIYDGRTYFEDGRYAAGSNGQVYGRDDSTLSRDLTRGARDIVRGTEDALDDVGRGIGNAARDITGNSSYSGTPSWEPDSSAVRY